MSRPRRPHARHNYLPDPNNGEAGRPRPRASRLQLSQRLGPELEELFSAQDMARAEYVLLGWAWWCGGGVSRAPSEALACEGPPCPIDCVWRSY